MSHIGKRYRIEQSFASPDGGVVSGSGDGRIGEILSTVQDLRRCFEPSQRRAGEVIEAYRREIAELYGLRAELDSMKGAIASTKREIATRPRTRRGRPAGPSGPRAPAGRSRSRRRAAAAAPSRPRCYGRSGPPPRRDLAPPRSAPRSGTAGYRARSRAS